MAAACVSTASTDSYWKAHKLLRSEKQLVSILSQFYHLSLILAVWVSVMSTTISFVVKRVCHVRYKMKSEAQQKAKVSCINLF